MPVNNIELRLNEMSLKDNLTGEKWGLELKDLYLYALSFYKGIFYPINYLNKF